ncbi:MAG: FliG C-terminal domain-containing protein, partial [bacterium]|nr:FliG C-terminal domain-containing protein [bacterium]
KEEPRLREKAEKMTSHLLETVRSVGEELEILLDSSEEGVGWVGSFLDSHPELQERFKKYRYGFDHLLTLKPEEQEVVYNQVENELLLRALQKLDKDSFDHFIRGLSAERKKVLKGLYQSHRAAFSEEEVRQARVLLVRVMRQQLFSK